MTTEPTILKAEMDRIIEQSLSIPDREEVAPTGFDEYSHVYFNDDLKLYNSTKMVYDADK